MAVELATAYVSIIPSAEGIGANLDKILGGPISDAADKAGADAGKRISDGLLKNSEGTGKKLIAALGLAALGGIALKAASDVEDANNTITRTTGATGKALDGLQASFKNVASGTGASFDTVAKALSELYQNTGLTGKALEGLTSQVVAFNRMSKDSPITVDALTRAMAGFNVPAKDMGKELDHLFQISQKTGVPLNELLGILQTAGPIAREFGFSLDFTAGFLAQLTKAGVDANSILPGLKRLFKDAADAGKEPAAALRDVIGQLDALVKAGDIIGARSLAVQVFGPRGVGLVDAALQGKISLQSLNDTMSLTGDGILDTAGKTGTLGGALGILKNNASLLMAEFAKPALEAANDLLRAMLPTIKDLAAGFATLPDPIKVGALALVGLISLLPTIGNASQALPLIGKVAEGIGTFFQLAAVRGLELVDALKAIEVQSIATQAVALWPLALAAALVVGTAALVQASIPMEDFDSELQKGAASGKKLGDVIIASATASQAPVLALKAAIFSLNDEFKKRADAGNADLESATKAGFATKALKDEIDRLVLKKREEDAAHKATQASLDKYTGAVEHGVSATEAFTHVTEEGQKAVQDLDNALLTAAGGQISYERNQINVAKANVALQVANAGLTTAQQTYNDAVAQFGPDSEQAVLAGIALTKATDDQKSAALDARQAQLDLANSSVAVTAAEQAQLDALVLLAGGHVTQAEAVDTEIARLQELADHASPEAVAGYDAQIYALLVLKGKLNDVEGEHKATVDVVDNASTVLGDIIGKLNTIKGSANIHISASPSLPGFATGGLIPGSPGAAVPVIAHGGEYVLSADIVNRIKAGAPSSGAEVFAPMASPKGAGGDTFNFGDIHVHGLSDPNTARDVGRQFAAGVIDQRKAVHAVRAT